MKSWTRVLAWQLWKEEMKYETIFLYKLDNVSRCFICVKPSVLPLYLEDNNRLVLQRFDMVEEIPEKTTPKFKLGDYVAVDREASRYKQKSTTISMITWVNIYHWSSNIRIQYKLLSSTEYDERQLRELTADEKQLYIPKPWTSSTI